MSDWLNFEKQEKGFERVKPISRDWFKQNIGKRIVFVRHVDTDSNRGYAFPKFGTVKEVYRSRVILTNSDEDVAINKIIEMGVEI